MKSNALPILSHAGIAVLLGSLALSIVPSGLKVGNGVKRSPESLNDVLNQLPKGHARIVRKALHKNSDSHRLLMIHASQQAMLSRRPAVVTNRKAA